jgi:hypothetical protein
MKTWPLQDAKIQFSQAVELAQSEGPKPSLAVASRWRCSFRRVSWFYAQRSERRVRPKGRVLKFIAPLKGSGIRLPRQRELPPDRKF